MPTCNVVLTEHHEDVIDHLVTSGRYQNASEAPKLAASAEAARIGFRDLDEGRFREVGDDDLEAFVASLGQQVSQRGRSSGT